MDLKKIKEKLERLKNGGGKKGFWKLPLGDSTVRITPNPKYEDSLMEFYMHYGVGGKNSFLCPKRNFSEKCVVCEFASKLWEEGGDSQTLARDLFAKQRFYSPVLVRGEEKEGIRWWSYSKTAYGTILDLMNNPDYGDITDPETGRDLILKCVLTKGKKFPDTTLQPRGKITRLCNDMTPAECVELLNGIVDIQDILDRKTPEEVQTILDQYLLTSNDKDAESVSKETEKFGGKEEEEKNSIDKAFEELGV